ncbi:MAG: primosomal protein N' [Candidatus Peribacteraceae bacterium]|nr:primosomal protein N' [Candidatus Peribacteraceae bacterium]
MSSFFYSVVTASRSSGIGDGLTYEGNGTIVPGSIVRVPLRNSLVEGIVFDVQSEKQEELRDIKRIKELLGDQPLLTEAQLRTVRWMAEYYVCSLRQALSVWLPPPPWKRVLPQEITGYRLAERRLPVRGKKQAAVSDVLAGKEWMSDDDVRRESGASKSVVQAMLKKGLLIEERKRGSLVVSVAGASPVKELPVLTPAQEAAYEQIKDGNKPALLFGITGSGKTEIYAQLIADAVAQGKQAIVLVPEILLTEHSIARFERLLHRSAIAVIHSKLTERERREEWKRIRSGAVSLVIGSRSALFSPLHRLGVIVLDEEHEWTYKNEQTPRYHARDTAEALARHAGARLVLGSASPSLESWAAAKSGRYALVRLPERYRQLPLPRVTVVDLAVVQFGTLYPFSPPLLRALEDRLRKREQSVLFLNRRGMASAVLCLQCRRRIVCQESQLPFTVHHTVQGRPYLLDHSTGVSADIPPLCPHCKSPRLRAIGAGTQKIETLLSTLFPQARVIRADSDTLTDAADMREVLRKMREGEADILLGTQTVVKGLDLPNVTLAVVLLADLGMSLPHFRSGERVFQLLTQLTGRSGRAKDGEVIIQTFRPDAPEIIAASKHDTEKFLDDEWKLRLHSAYPPASGMIRFITRGEGAQERAKRLHASVQRAIAAEKSDAKSYVAPTFWGGGRQWHVLIRGTDIKCLLPSLDLKDVSVDVDPLETM